MATEYDRLFGTRSLNGRVDAFAQDITRTRVFTSKFEQGRSLVAEDGTFEWDELTFSRSLAPVRGHMGPHPLRQDLARVNRRSSVAVVKEACLFLGKIEYRAAVGDLIELLRSKDLGLAYNALWALREITNQHIGADPGLWEFWLRESGWEESSLEDENG